MTIKELVRVPPLPSARLPCDTFLGDPYTIPVYIIVGMVVYRLNQ
jgi:hypothetical protein